jgi:hypothetical protein
MPNVKTTLTRNGYTTLINKGLIDSITYFNISDKTHLYDVTASEMFVPDVTGTHDTITNGKCAFAKDEGIFTNKPTPQEIQNAISQVQISFVNENCAYGNFNKSNLNVDINVNSWIANLPTTYSYDTSNPTLTLDLFDYIQAIVQKLNLSTKSYDSVKYLTNLGISWSPNTETDLRNLLLVSPRYVSVNTDGTRVMTDNSNISNASPFFLSWSTYSVNGTSVPATAGRLSIVPNEMGYYVTYASGGNGVFLKTSQVETVDSNTFTSILPAAIVGNRTFVLTNNVEYPTETGFWGYALNMYNVNNDGTTLMTALKEQVILFMKTYGTPDSASPSNTTYRIPITLNCITTNPEINFLSTKFGDQLKINLIYDSAITTQEPIIYY